MRRLINGSAAAPLAGHDFTFIPSTSDKVKLLAVTATLTTSAAVANRLPSIDLKTQNGDKLFAADVVTFQTAGLAVQYSWAIGANINVRSAEVTAEQVSGALPDMILMANDSVFATTAAIDVADQWSSVFYRALVWDEEEHFAELAAYFASMKA